MTELGPGGRPHAVLNGILPIFLVSMLVMLRALAAQGFFSVHVGDTFAYTGWAWQFTRALKEGIIYPRWMPLDFYGYGSPVFILYPPLAFYLTAFLNIFTGSIIRAMGLLEFAALFAAGSGVFFLAREFYEPRTALIAALLYVVLPYNISQIYLLGNFAQNISAAWFAPVLLFTYRYLKQRKTRNIIFAGMCYGGLILTHLISAYMFTFVLAAFVLFYPARRKKLKNIAAFLMITAIGAFISAAYLLPIVFEKKFVDLRTFITGKWLVYSSFFILPDKTAKMVNVAWSEYYSVYVFHMLFLGALLVLFSVRSGIQKKGPRQACSFFAFAAAASMFLLFGPSTFIWESVPFFRYIQFPVRWLSITAFSVVFLSAAYVSRGSIEGVKKRQVIFIMAMLLVACAATDTFLIEKAQIFTQTELLPPGGSYWTFEHLPKGVNPNLISSKDKKINILAGNGKIFVTEWKPAERKINIAAANPAILRIAIFNFPGWIAYLDGQPVQIQTQKGTDAMLIEIPEGTHTLVLKFMDTPVRLYGKIISILSISSILIFALAEKTGFHFKRSSSAGAVF